LKPVAKIEVHEMVKMPSKVDNDLNLRYMQVVISLEAGSSLPGARVPHSFPVCEFITLLERTEKGLLCYLRLEFASPQELQGNYGGFEILEVISRTSHSALVKALAGGPISMIFCKHEDAWWISPTLMSHNGFKMTIRGTKDGLRRIRSELSLLVGNGFSVKLGSESLQSPEFSDLLPEKQRLVLDKAIEMGYYSRPRGCTQRDVAEAMNIKQATVSEHLQSAESKIIHSIR
tara:strand:- start:3291 stop:3986 length:696 start_codon:yes stop_codon:yes gene_type:complete